MTTPPQSVEERIILAAIECVERYGVAGATNRRVSQRAGVNAAAINYYFRSKDNLIKKVMERTLENAFDLNGMPPMPGLDARERCTAIMVDLILGGHQYPGLTRAHFLGLVEGGPSKPLLTKRINRFVEDLAADLRGRGLQMPDAEMHGALTQMLYVALLATLVPSLFEGRKEFDLRDRGAATVYMRRLADRLLTTG